MFRFPTGKVSGRHRILVICRRSARVTGRPHRDRGPPSWPPGGPRGPWVTGIRWRLSPGWGQAWIRFGHPSKSDV